MDTIYECASKFASLKNFEYYFVVSHKRKTKSLLLNFQDSDFFHLAGFHYLSDINIPQNRHNTLKDILEKKKITDQLLNKSRFYSNPKPDRDIKSRIEHLDFLEEYLDNNNLVYIYNTQNNHYLQSFIKADYLIESQLKNSKHIVYIFLKKRELSNSFCIVSFFKKDKVTYGGDKLYWMLKEKRMMNKTTVLFRHPNYTLESLSTHLLPTSIPDNLCPKEES